MIYILKAGDKYKIGITFSEISKRIKALQTGCPYKIEIIHTYETNNSFIIEQTLHNRYKDKNSNGEWFILNEQDIEDIKGLIVEFDKNFVFIEKEYKETIPKIEYNIGDIIEYQIVDKKININNEIISCSEMQKVHKIGKITNIDLNSSCKYIVDNVFAVPECDVTNTFNELKGTVRHIIYW